MRIFLIGKNKTILKNLYSLVKEFSLILGSYFMISNIISNSKDNMQIYKNKVYCVQSFYSNN